MDENCVIRGIKLRKEAVRKIDMEIGKLCNQVRKLEQRKEAIYNEIYQMATSLPKGHRGK